MSYSRSSASMMLPRLMEFRVHRFRSTMDARVPGIPPSGNSNIIKQKINSAITGCEAAVAIGRLLGTLAAKAPEMCEVNEQEEKAGIVVVVAQQLRPWYESQAQSQIVGTVELFHDGNRCLCCS